MSPPVVDVAKTTLRPFDLGPYTIPTGESVRASPLLLHARADLYPEPERFRPTRFLDRRFSPFEFIPFGGGARRCLGAAFAMYEMKVVLGTLLRGRRLRLAGRGPVAETRRGLLMGPRGGEAEMLGGQTPFRIRSEAQLEGCRRHGRIILEPHPARGDEEGASGRDRH